MGTRIPCLNSDIDILASDSRGRWIVIEVRGVRNAKPVELIFSEHKRRSILRNVERVLQRGPREVRCELWVITGRFPQSRGRATLVAAAARFFPTQLGFSLQRFPL